nr:SLBB domain-containing protein [uncultured Blautia sp.]
MTILSEQSFGGKCGLLVSPGDQVKAGALIGKPEAFMAAPLHASVTGEVLDVKEVCNQGRMLLACIIKADEKQEQGRTEQKYETELIDINEISREEILDGIRNGGLTGMGGAGFPTHKKYETDKIIDTLLINGVALLFKASGAKEAVICIEDNKPEAIKRLREILDQGKNQNASQGFEGIRVEELLTQYPQGGERQLIQGVLNKEVPAGGLPADVGVIVSNIGTARAAADMVLGKTPLIRRIVTVTGCVKQPGNYLVPVGTSAKELVARCGGPMTGPCVASDWDDGEELFYVTKNTSGILVLPDSQEEEQPCIRCSSCANVCPAGLVPYQIEYAFLEEDYDLCEQLHASECIACGCCSYTCPAKRELSVRTRMARDMVKQRMRERAVKKA